MNSIGEQLRQARESQGLDLGTIAERTKIGVRYLKAIEAGEFDVLPGGFFRKSFVRQYGDELGVDVTALEPDLEVVLGIKPPSPPEEILPTMLAARLPTPKPLAHHRIEVEPLEPSALWGVTGRAPKIDPRLAWSVALLVFALGACSFVFALWQRTNELSAKVSEPQFEIRPQEHSAEQPPVAMPERNPTAPVPVSTAPPRSQGRAGEPLAEGGLSLHLAAVEDTWVEVTSRGKRLFTGILEPEETRRITAAEKARMVIGNAGGIEVRWNGRPIGPIGPRGHVRVVEFTPQSYLILPAQPREL